MQRRRRTRSPAGKCDRCEGARRSPSSVARRRMRQVRDSAREQNQTRARSSATGTAKIPNRRTPRRTNRAPRRQRRPQRCATRIAGAEARTTRRATASQNSGVCEYVSHLPKFETFAANLAPTARTCARWVRILSTDAAVEHDVERQLQRDKHGDRPAKCDASGPASPARARRPPAAAPGASGSPCRRRSPPRQKGVVRPFPAPSVSSTRPPGARRSRVRRSSAVWRTPQTGDRPRAGGGKQPRNVAAGAGQRCLASEQVRERNREHGHDAAERKMGPTIRTS